MTMLPLARNAFLESIRQPIFAVIVLMGMLALVLNLSLAAFTLEDDNKLLVDLGLSSVFLGGLLLAACTATSVLSQEIENRTVLTVVSKPVPRPAVVVGKYLGVSAAIALGLVTLAATFLLTVRHRVAAGEGDPSFDGPVLVFGLLAVVAAVGTAALANFFGGRPFASVFAVIQPLTATLAVAAVWCLGRDWRFQHPLGEWNPQLMLGLGLIAEAVLVLAAVAIAASTRSGRTVTLMICVAVFLWGLVSEYFLGTMVADPSRGWIRWLAWPAYAVLPNMQFFWPADSLTQGREITLAHAAAVSLYALLSIVASLGLAVLLFQRRDVS